MKCSLAFDMGATSIRGILGYVENGKLVTEEILRFSHDRVKIDERSRWDWEKIINNISETIFKYKDKIESVGNRYLGCRLWNTRYTWKFNRKSYFIQRS